MTERDRPFFVTVTPEMEKAGLAELLDVGLGGGAGYLVRSIYMAMEYERRDSLGELGAITDEAVQILKSQTRNV